MQSEYVHPRNHYYSFVHTFISTYITYRLQEHESNFTVIRELSTGRGDGGDSDAGGVTLSDVRPATQGDYDGTHSIDDSVYSRESEDDEDDDDDGIADDDYDDDDEYGENSDDDSDDSDDDDDEDDDSDYESEESDISDADAAGQADKGSNGKGGSGVKKRKHSLLLPQKPRVRKLGSARFDSVDAFRVSDACVVFEDTR